MFYSDDPPYLPSHIPLRGRWLVELAGQDPAADFSSSPLPLAYYTYLGEWR
jgi:hypothetical protein